MAIPATTERVTLNTSYELNERIERQTERNIAYYAAFPDRIDDRLTELDHEWDIERTLEANAASITVGSVVLGILSSRKWFFLSALVGGFLLQHAVQGWCPPLPLMRRLGMRTQTEIERERYALKALRGDFDHVTRLTLEAKAAARSSRQILEATS